MNLVRYIPVNTKVPFMKAHRKMLALSVLLVSLTIIMLFVRGLNFGVDFKGGLLLEVRTQQAANLAELRQAAAGLNLGETTVQTFGSPRDVLLRVQVPDGINQQQAHDRVKAVLPAGAEVRRTEFVGPAVGQDLIRKGVMAFVFSLVAIFIYLWFRFEWQFGVAAIVAVVHDIILTVGIYVLSHLEFNLGTVAAILTIAGYSVNDTVVVFDRVRDNLKKYRKMPFIELIDRSLNETLSRTLLTSTTTLVALLCLYFLGGETLRGFCLAMLWGIVVGTYSSIFVAVPLVLYLPVIRPEEPLEGEVQRG